jgi:hypothetical protein
VGTVSPGNTLIFDGQTQGESVYDPALGESTTWYRLADVSGWVSGLYMGAASTPTPSPSPSPTQPNPFDDVRQMFLDAARQYPQVGNAITDVQDQGGGVFRQEFERAIMIWNGQQVTVYETKGRSASTTSPSSEPQVNNPSGFTPVLNFNSGGKSPNGNWIFLNQDDKGQQIEQIKQKILNLGNQINAIEASKATYGSQISEKEKEVKDKKDQANKLSWPNSWNPLDLLKAGQLTIEAGLIEYGTLPQLRAQYSATITRLNQLKQELDLSRQELKKLNPLPTTAAEAERFFKDQHNSEAVKRGSWNNCGPSSLAMVIAALGLESPGGLTMQGSIDSASKLMGRDIDANTTTPPQIKNGIESQKVGRKAEDIGGITQKFSERERWDNLDRCLREQKPVVSWGHITQNWANKFDPPNGTKIYDRGAFQPTNNNSRKIPHVIAILGKTSDNQRYIVADPSYPGGPVEMSRSELSVFWSNEYDSAPTGYALA